MKLFIYKRFNKMYFKGSKMDYKTKSLLFCKLLSFFICIQLVVSANAITITETQFDVVAGEFTEENASISNVDTLQKTHPDHLLIESMVWNGGWVHTDGPMWGGVSTADALKDAGDEWWQYNAVTTIGVEGVGAGYIDYRWKDDYEYHPAFDGWDLDSISILVGQSDVNLQRVNYKLRIEVLSHDWLSWQDIDMSDAPGIQQWLEGGSDTVGVGTKIEIKNIGIEDIRGVRVYVEQGWQAAFNNDGTANTGQFWGSPLIAEMDINLTDLSANDPNTTNDYTGGATREELEYLLEKSITLTRFTVGEALIADYFTDNLRMVKRLQPRYIARAAFTWDVFPSENDPHMADDERFFDAADTYALLVHQEMPDVVLEACIFETAYSAYDPDTQDRINMGFSGAGVEQIPIPAWVFTEFGLPVETRNFSYEDMIYADGRYDNIWLPGTSVPDLTRQEAQMWFYYRAKRFIDAGYEGLHFGQIQLMNENDTDNTAVQSVVNRIRNYAATNARRHWIFCNAHAYDSANDQHGFAVNGNLIFDFHMFPLRPKEVIGSPYDAVLEVGHLDSIYGNSIGGVTPSGWSCDSLPYAVEFDNSIGADPANPNHNADINHFSVWGWDEASWFAHQDEDFRNQWLWYAHNWIEQNAPNGFLMMFGARPAADPVNVGLGYLTWYYRANTFSADCLAGFNQEDTIHKIWNSNCSYNSMANLDGDCDVDLSDFAIFANGWLN
jgi:hypothetical protein